MDPTDPTSAQAAAAQVTPCWFCGFALKANSNLTGPAPQPKPGDVSLCANCGAYLIFGEDMKPREPLIHELTRLPPRINALASAIQRIIRHRGRIHP